MLLEGIETLLMLSQEKTMSRAGSQLYISQSAVSKRISLLEKKLGKKLIVPDGRYIRLTADAKELIDSVAPTFQELQGRLYDQHALQDDTLIRLDCSETLVAGYLNQMMGDYLQQDSAVTITTHHTPRIVERVQSGKATLGFCAGYITSAHGLKVTQLWEEPFVIVSQQSLTQLPKQILTNDLGNPANRYQLDILSQLGIEPLMQMDSYTASAQLALGGVAAALVPLSIINALKIESKYCFSFDELKPLYRPVHLCVRANTYRSERIKKLMKAIADVVPTES
ncbi:LysR family transcriptional regulator [Vibrio sp. S17_S38]|uniref:LysR family transcriptional regulator n=1 Tax=Vibrio sp. S17_S38 TaxID=2720229 RepID=UPI0016818E84|nr:LysR family transcriptional regulator [Vibrio sp. S17_S38]MBD1573861.1 LysR family transcriptional regulator [Vibrio sp. S17_S38]